MSKIKKMFSSRRKKESDLINSISNIRSRGSFMNSMMEKHIETKKYKNAKKRYLDILDEADQYIKDLRQEVDQEEAFIKKQNKHNLMHSESTKIREIYEKRNFGNLSNQKDE